MPNKFNLKLVQVIHILDMLIDINIQKHNLMIQQINIGIM